MRLEVVVDAGDVPLAGHLSRPTAATGLVLFAHGSGSSRLSPRNAFVATRLNDGGLATLLFDLLTKEEAGDRANVFDVSLLGARLAAAADWAARHREAKGLPRGYFGASTGAAAALVAAAMPGSETRAVVSRGGRPDLAGPSLAAVSAPTLLIVGSLDPVVEGLNREAMAKMRCGRHLEVVAGASHLFEEPGTLETVADLAADWFASHLGRA